MTPEDAERPVPLSPALDRLRSELEATKHRAQEVADGLSVVEFNERLKPGTWSISECLSHLVTAGEAYLPMIEAAIEEASSTARAGDEPGGGPRPRARPGRRAAGEEGDLEGGARAADRRDRSGLDWSGRLLLWLMEPPPKLRMPAPPAFAPASHLAVRRVLPPFLALQDRLVALLARCEGLDFDRIRVASPANRFLRPNLRACLAMLAAHERRHLWQAEQIREELLVRRISQEHPFARGIRPPEDLPHDHPAEEGGAAPS